MATARERAAMDREAYDEQAWEMRANDIPPPTFKAWKARNAAIRKMLAERKKAEAK